MKVTHMTSAPKRHCTTTSYFICETPPYTLRDGGEHTPCFQHAPECAGKSLPTSCRRPVEISPRPLVKLVERHGDHACALNRRLSVPNIRLLSAVAASHAFYYLPPDL